jgi:hypothetical protein
VINAHLQEAEHSRRQTPQRRAPEFRQPGVACLNAPWRTIERVDKSSRSIKRTNTQSGSCTQPTTKMLVYFRLRPRFDGSGGRPLHVYATNSLASARLKQLRRDQMRTSGEDLQHARRPKRNAIRSLGDRSMQRACSQWCVPCRSAKPTSRPISWVCNAGLAAFCPTGGASSRRDTCLIGEGRSVRLGRSSGGVAPHRSVLHLLSTGASWVGAVQSRTGCTANCAPVCAHGKATDSTARLG